VPPACQVLERWPFPSSGSCENLYREVVREGFDEMASMIVARGLIF
jgi:hypothetical protein